MSWVYAFRKFLDQPSLIHRLENSVPLMLGLGGTGYVGYATYNAPQGERGKAFVKAVSVAASTGLSAFWAFRFFKEPEAVHDVVKAAKDLLNQAPANSEVRQILQKIVDNSKAILSPKELKSIHTALPKIKDEGKEVSALTRIIPDPEFEGIGDGLRGFLGEIKKIGNLSAMGLVPVLGGVAGGVLGNVVTGSEWRDPLKRQSQEATFQYLANIVLCNVGAITALLGLKLIAPSKMASQAWRLSVMVGGIVALGILGGSAIANVIGNNLLNPLFERGPTATLAELKQTIGQHGLKGLFKDLYSYRYPEPLDWALHIDDLACAGVMAGLGWIEPILPLMYSLSGVRSAEGYRNGKGALKEASTNPRPEKHKITPKFPLRTAADFQSVPPRQLFVPANAPHQPVAYRAAANGMHRQYQPQYAPTFPRANWGTV